MKETAGGSSRRIGKGFFPMPRREQAALAGITAFSVAAFLPALSGITLAGVSLFGWMMAALLLGCPTLLLTLLRAEMREARRGPAGSHATSRPGA